MSLGGAGGGVGWVGGWSALPYKNTVVFRTNVTKSMWVILYKDSQIKVFYKNITI